MQSFCTLFVLYALGISLCLDLREYIFYVLSESLMHLTLRMIFRRKCLNFINVRTAYASKIQASPTKNSLANSGPTRFREHIFLIGGYFLC